MLLYSITIHLVQSRVGDDSEIAMDVHSTVLLGSGSLLAVDRRERTLLRANKTTAMGQTIMSINTDEDDAKEDHKKNSDVGNGETCMRTIRMGTSV